MRRVVFLLVALFVLLGCRPESILPPATPISEAEIAQTPVPVAPTSAWYFRDPLPVEKPALVEHADGMALDPNWRIARAEYVYQWWGLAPEPDLKYQVVTQTEGTYQRNGKEISEDVIATFLDSISRFTPIQQTIGGNAWTDDYPTYTIEVTGEDGQQLLFISNSTGNAGDGPWNLLYNDQLYAQYDGSFGESLNGVFDFDGRATEYAAGPIVNFSTQSAPLQLVYGFSGLLPLADAFQYQADLTNEKITGIFIGRSSIGGFGNMIIGTFTDTTAITLTLEDSSTVSCTFEVLPGFAEQDPAGAGWQFECPMTTVAPTEGTPYRYGITIGLVNDESKAESVSGTLTGLWSQHPTLVRLPLPPAIAEGLAAHTDASALLGRHDYAFANYNASVDAAPPHTATAITGEMTLYGSTAIAEQLIPYQLLTLFTLQNGKAPQWGVSETSFDTLLTTAMALTSTQTLLEQYPDVQLSLGSITNLDMSDTPMMWNSYNPGFRPTGLTSCLNQPALSLSEDDFEYQEVGYRFADGRSSVTGILLDGHWYPYDATLQIGQAVPALKITDDLLLTEGYFRLSRNDFYSTILFGLDPELATPESIAHFEAIAAALGAEPNYDGDIAEHPEWYQQADYTLALAPDGGFQLLSCGASGESE